MTRSKRTRVPLAVAVKFSAPLPPLTSAVSVPSPPSIRSVSSPGFQIMRSLPASPNTWSSPSPPVSVSLPSPPNSRSAPPLPSSVSLPAWPNSWSSPEPPVSVSLPSPPNRFARGSAPLVSSSAIVSLPPRPKTWIRLVLATVAVPPWIVHRAAVDENGAGRVAADRDRVVEGVAEYRQHAGGGAKVAVTAMVVVLSNVSRFHGAGCRGVDGVQRSGSVQSP